MGEARVTVSRKGAFGGQGWLGGTNRVSGSSRDSSMAPPAPKWAKQRSRGCAWGRCDAGKITRPRLAMRHEGEFWNADVARWEAWTAHSLWDRSEWRQLAKTFRQIRAGCLPSAYSCQTPQVPPLRDGWQLLALLGIFGSGGRDRTYDQLINSQLLYR